MLTTFAELAAAGQPVHLAIGMFDGLHLGHQAVLGAARQSALAAGEASGVLTFYPHPSAVLRPEARTLLIQPLESKLQRLREIGVSAVVTQEFTPEFAAIEAEGFMAWLRSRLPALRAVYVGENWRFGRGRRGDVAMLERLGREAGVSVASVARLHYDGEPLSSTRVRRLLAAGQIALANRLLGYDYFALGPVLEGKHLGRTLGFPTLNLRWEPELRPALGVYAVRLWRGPERSGPCWPAVANYGLRPTVEGAAAAPLLEAHALDECPLGYGDVARVEWLEFLRPEQKFAGVEALRDQIARDREAALAWHRRRRAPSSGAGG